MFMKLTPGLIHFKLVLNLRIFFSQIENGESLPVDLIQPFSKAMNHASNDVKQLLAVIATFVAKSSTAVLPADLLKSLLVRF